MTTATTAHATPTRSGGHPTAGREAPGRAARTASSDVRDRHRRELRAGALAMAPFVVGYVPFALLVGVTVARSTDPLAGWSATLPLYGGSAQLTLLELFAGGAAVGTAAGAAVLINTRLLVYSTALLPLFGTTRLRTRLAAAAFVVDPTWVVALRRAESPGTLTERRWHYAGAAAALTAGWLAVLTAGVLVGQVEAQVLSVVGPLCLIALVVPHLRLPGGTVAVGAALVVTLASTALPLPPGTGLLAAMAAAGLAGTLAAGARGAR